MKEYNCTKCKGTGWALEKKEDGTEMARKCECKKEDIIISRGTKANLPARFLGAELEWSLVDNSNPSQNKIKKIAQKFIRDYPAVENSLLLQGGIGLGKTSILCAIGYELIKKKNTDVYYIDWNDLVREMRTGEDHSVRDFTTINTLVQRLIAVELLLFDELGASKISPWVYDNIYYVFNRRYNNKKVTVCATNYLDRPIDGKESLTQRIGDRIRSRLYDMTKAYELKGSDFRRKNN
ncbi:MAG: ATP-binding protein [bacterium]|nr:ATP-binding protein [bacterium]